MSFAILYCFIASSAVPSAQFLLSTDSPVSRLHAFDFTQANETAVGKIATELSIFVMQSVDGAPCCKCLHRHSSRPGVKPILLKRGSIRGSQVPLSLSLSFLSLFHQQHGIEPDERIVFTALCIFHIGFAFMFHLRQLKGEQLCGP